ncbi:GAF domain-containing protein [Thermus thermamylovorans]|uniref:GAF domain-containing protein n=1 Tax=Thermus thermamylovorans TaxID=2509362 RepID=A0A4Q9B3U9_9DEIN|nr:GAF domain-containing protein [Thermus thermamylovorans]TBH20068.1 GAF domain-containing protein [Thermus thermamylovorans]
MRPLARLQLDAQGRAMVLEADPSLGLEGNGLPCAALVQGQDPFGRPLCPRCPVQRELKRGAYRASTPLLLKGRRLRCQGYRENRGFLVELYPERAEPPDLLLELSRLARHLLDRPEHFPEALETFLGTLRKSLGMEATELFLADPEGHHLLLTAYEGLHREAFLERPWFQLGEGYPGLVALRREPLYTHALKEDPRYLRQKVKQLGYQTYICYPLELPHGLIGVLNLASRDPEADHEEVLEALSRIGPLFASTLYTLLTRLGEVGLFALGAHLQRGEVSEGQHNFLRELRRLSGATGVRLVGRSGERLELGFVPPCAMRDCPAWRGEVMGLKNGLPPCPETEGRPRICLPLWAQGGVVAVGTLFHARPPKPPTGPAAPALWLSRLAIPLLFARAREDPPELEVHALGGFRLRYRGQELSPKSFGRSGAYRLFKFLLANKDRALYTEELLETFFPDLSPERARQELYALVYHLRKTLPGVVEREGEYYRLHLPEKRFLDFERFEELMRKADLEEGLSAFKTLRQALELYKGPLFGDDPYGEWAEAERAYLQDRALSGLLRLGELAEALGYKEVAREAYARALKLEPFLEEARERLLALKG